MRYEFAPMLGPAEKFVPGSVDWAERISNRLQLATDSLSRATVHDLQKCIHQIWQADPHPWDVWPKNKPFRTPDDYFRAVTGHPWKALQQIIREMGSEQSDLLTRMNTDLARAQVKHRKQGAHHKNVKMKPGQTADYLLRRLARDHPVILERYERGEFKSVRAAAIAAGIITIKTPFDQARRALPKCSRDELCELRADIDKLLDK
jgi:hypothetical protein